MNVISYPFLSLSWMLDRILNRRFPEPVAVDKNVKIFVFRHRKGPLPECFQNREVFVPIQGGVGPAIEPDILRETDEPSIAEWNVYLNEMTQLYWIGKHLEQLGSPDYIGFAHYRRCLDWIPDLLAPNTMIASRFVSHLSNRDFFVQNHGSKWLDLFLGQFFLDKDLQTYEDISIFMSSHTMYIANNFITDCQTFKRYFYFVEKCLAICLKLLRENNEEFARMDASMRRQFSFIMERMTSYWIWHEKRCKRINVISARLKCYDIDNGLTSVR